MRDRDPYKKPNFGTEAYSFYLYYFRPSVFGNKPRVLFYQSKANKLSPSIIRRIVTEYAECAALGIDVPPPCAANFAWKKKSYLVIMVDEEGWQFADEAILFDTDGTLPNHTFYHAEHDNVTIRPEGEGERKVEIFYCINHMKRSLNDDQDLKKNESQSFSLKIRRRGGSLYPYSADGTNLGPPVPPPHTSESFLKRLFRKFVFKLQDFLGF